jgi:uncharacterized iron-regulated protein
MEHSSCKTSEDPLARHHQHSFAIATALLAGILLPIGIVGGMVAASDTKDPLEAGETLVVETAALSGLDDLIPNLLDRRVVFVGEQHDRYEDHLSQLAIISGLHEQGRDIAIGMEFFQQPFQGALDAYLAGDIDEAGLLRRTEYFERWRYDYRLYRPILRYAREHGLPLIALNVAKEITDKVGDVGIAGLDAAERDQVPAEIDRGDDAYRARVKAVFDMHPKDDDADFERFLDVQLLWDEGMAERAAAFLEANPDTTLVVLAGGGHVEHGHGIPARVARRIDVPSAIIINGANRPLTATLADFILFPPRRDLPGAGLIGVMLDTESEGEGLGIQGFAEVSGAKAAGIEEGDRIVKVGDTEIDDYTDIRIALMDSAPGDHLPVEVLRKPFVGGAKRLRFDVELH